MKELEFAQKEFTGYEKVKYLGKVLGYDAYIPLVGEDLEGAAIGLPNVFFKKEDKFERATPEECFKVLDIYNKHIDGQKIRLKK